MVALDASALLAFLFAEAGHERVSEVIDDCCLSSVNLAEVASRFARDGHNPMELVDQIDQSAIRVMPFLTEDAAAVAALAPQTRHLGLSLGDRACLALALAQEIPAMTADRMWGSLDLPIPVELIR